MGANMIIVKRGFFTQAFTRWVTALRPQLNRQRARWLRCFSLQAESLPRRRALPAHPLTIHLGASNCRF